MCTRINYVHTYLCVCKHIDTSGYKYMFAHRCINLQFQIMRDYICYTCVDIRWYTHIWRHIHISICINLNTYLYKHIIQKHTDFICLYMWALVYRSVYSLFTPVYFYVNTYKHAQYRNTGVITCIQTYKYIYMCAPHVYIYM